jgi:hypothetical protein
MQKHPSINNKLPQRHHSTKNDYEGFIQNAMWPRIEPTPTFEM